MEARDHTSKPAPRFDSATIPPPTSNSAGDNGKINKPSLKRTPPEAKENDPQEENRSFDPLESFLDSENNDDIITQVIFADTRVIDIIANQKISTSSPIFSGRKFKIHQRRVRKSRSMLLAHRPCRFLITSRCSRILKTATEGKQSTKSLVYKQLCQSPILMRKVQRKKALVPGTSRACWTAASSLFLAVASPRPPRHLPLQCLRVPLLLWLITRSPHRFQRHWRP